MGKKFGHSIAVAGRSLRTPRFWSLTFDLVGIIPLLLLVFAPPAGKVLHVATSAQDPELILQIRGLSSTIDPEEAREVAACAYNTGLDLRRKWGVVPGASWLPALQNLFIKTGTKKGGYCFQYVAQLLVRMNALKLKTIELHWAESEVGTPSENNALVVTARGQPFQQGVLFDNWRAQGHLVWTHVLEDPEYHWQEGKAFQAEVLERANRKTPTSDR